MEKEDAESRSGGEPVERSKGEDIRVRTKKLALRVIRVYRALPRTEEARVIGRQLLRSGTSVGANYRAACRARSKKEFAAIALEEADETTYWLELLVESGILRELTAIFVASLRTARAD
jgi:four helix bundle protein